jgi:hypothetical protein
MSSPLLDNVYVESGAVSGVPRVNPLTWFGVVAVSAMLLTYAFEKRSPGFVLAFAGACVLASAYGFLAGAWPFGAIEAVWAIVAVRRWYVSVTRSY